MNKTLQKYNKKGLKYGQILGINVYSTSLSQVLTRVSDLLSDNIIKAENSNKFSIVTPNPELVLMAQTNTQLKQALNSSAFPIPDGNGLNYAYKYLFNEHLNIIHGRVLFGKLIALADKNKWKVFLLGGRDNEALRASEKIKAEYKNIKIKTFKGPVLDNNAETVTEINRKTSIDTFKMINRYKPHILFVAFGNPKQEIWIYKNLKRLSVGGVMSVGGTLRYVAGFSELPPKWVEDLGLEWLHRLILEPQRIGRIINAVIIFPLKVFSYKIKHPSI
jgi:N-acetylglucosaminyldiphosphoundecaprenol N-acetyl-beta-D-mannosaminyltransferase